MKIISQEEFETRIVEKHPNQPFEIIEYTRISKPLVIKCLQCGKIQNYSSAGNFIASKRKNLCSCYTSNNPSTRKEESRKQIEDLIQKNPNLKLEGYQKDEKNKKNLVVCKCEHCNQIFSKPVSEFLKHPKCPYCQGKEKMNTQSFAANLPKDYELLSEYKNCEEKVKIRHSCGFVWLIKPKKMLNYIGCPHCNKKKSKGEQRIIQILLDKNISFESEKSFEWQSNKLRRYDFYIPKYNLVIEYMGEQHYMEVPTFKYSLEEQQKIDAQKRQEALENNYNYLEIKYTDYNNLEVILDNWFNDYPEKE